MNSTSFTLRRQDSIVRYILLSSGSIFVESSPPHRVFVTTIAPRGRASSLSISTPTLRRKEDLHRNHRFSQNEKKYAPQHPHYHNYHGTTPTIYTFSHPSDTRNYRRDTMIYRIIHPCRHHRETHSVDSVDVDNRYFRCLRLYHGWGLYNVPLDRQLWR